MGESYRRGEVPVWNPWMYCGMAQMAVPSPGIFYPLNIYFYALPFSSALALFLITHQLLAGIGAFLLVLSLGWGGLAAAVAALSCAWCGYMFSMTSNFTLMSTIAWLPLAVFCVRRIRSEFSTNNMLAVASTAVTVFMMLAAGRPEVSVPAALVLAIFAIADVVARYRDDRLGTAALKQLGWRALSGCLGILLAMPIIVPALEWAQLSPRAAGMDPRYVFMWSANWYDWLCVVLPQPFGDVSELGSKFLSLTASRAATIPYLPSAFVGPIVFVLAVWGVCDRTWTGRWLVLGIGLGSTLMALGKFTPVAPLVVSASSALASFRYPVKLMIIPVLCLILLAARGTYLAHHRWVGWKSLIATLVLSVLGIVAGGVMVLTPGLAQLAFSNPYFSTRIANLTDLTEAQILLGYHVLVMSAVGAGVCGLYFALLRRKLTRLAFGAVLLFTQGLLLLYAPTHHSRKFTAGDFYDRPVPLAREIKELCECKSDRSFTWRAQVLCYDPLFVPQGYSKNQKLPFTQAYYQYARQMQITNCHLPFAVPYSFGYEAAESGVYKDLYDRCLGRSSQNRFHDFKRTDDRPLANFCRYTSTRYLWTQAWIQLKDKQTIPKMDARLFRLVREDIDANLRVYECIDVLPRTYFASKIAWKESSEDVKYAIVDGKNAFRTYLESDTADTEAIEQCSLIDEPGDYAVIGSQGAQRTEVSTRSAKARLLVLNDHVYNGWTAKVDGKTVPIYRANTFARAVIVPEGDHTVVFEFASPSLRLAGYLLCGALIVIAGLIVATILRRCPVPGDHDETEANRP